MESLISVVILLAVIFLRLTVTRIATVALTCTGLSHELAKFQARSAFSGCGFTTREAESMVEHPVRRRIILLLMLFGNGTVVIAISALIPIVVNTEGSSKGFLISLLSLFFGLIVLWLVASSKWIDRKLSLLISWALKTFTKLDVYDYSGLLHFSKGFTVSEFLVDENDWLVGKKLSELRLSDEGVNILSIHRADDEFLGTPIGETYIRNKDKLILYGHVDQLAELVNRPVGSEGDKIHQKRVSEHLQQIEEQQQEGRDTNNSQSTK